jgi:two-component system KDP operon response regulator KdpE
MDGFRVLGRIREWSDVPVVVVSARQEEAAKVRALDGGANDYVTKPFASGELLARMRAAIRIYKRSTDTRRAGVFSNGGLMVDFERRAVAVDGNPIHLTPIEYKILVLLAQNAGKALSHDHILGALWGPYGSESQTLRVNIANIRKKIEKNPARPAYIVTEVGVGYRMAEIAREPG